MGPLNRVAQLCGWLVLASACQDDPSFQPLSTLCEDLAEDICDARAGGCCGVVDPMKCAPAEVERCKAELTGLTGEALRYDSVDAARLRRAARSELDHCGAPPALRTFFTGGLSDGAQCERDTQCAGGMCAPETRVCAVAPAPSLCGAP
ncbi:MAG TPA: hypothetical protein VI299_20300 [Polyangiales bacterium]